MLHFTNIGPYMFVFFYSNKKCYACNKGGLCLSTWMLSLRIPLLSSLIRGITWYKDTAFRIRMYLA
jgi:hypothetical protein